MFTGHSAQRIFQGLGRPNVETSVGNRPGRYPFNLQSLMR